MLVIRTSQSMIIVWIFHYYGIWLTRIPSLVRARTSEGMSMREIWDDANDLIYHLYVP